MTTITLAQRLPFVAVTVRANGQSLTLSRVLLDTGSAGTAFKTEDLEQIGVFLQPQDQLVRLRGIGGMETVVRKQIEAVQVGDLVVHPMTIQLGELDYAITMDGILGADFLLKAGAVVDFAALELRKG
ncbi:MAG: retroviral-like aspartic protease family protein [Anaerolineae bacterium]|nr:retroviral-like aspartic protease family protein [Anaerolineae bacterium]